MRRVQGVHASVLGQFIQRWLASGSPPCHCTWVVCWFACEWQSLRCCMCSSTGTCARPSSRMRRPNRHGAGVNAHGHAFKHDSGACVNTKLLCNLHALLGFMFGLDSCSVTQCCVLAEQSYGVSRHK